MDQTKGYQQIFEELESYLCEITGFTACSLQPNSGAQGEYAGLLTIKAYHEANGDHHRNITLIPQSAHGTNPASAVLAGMQVVVVKCDDKGNIDVSDLREKLPGLEPPPALYPEQARFRLFDSITTFLKSAAQSRPLLLCSMTCTGPTSPPYCCCSS